MIIMIMRFIRKEIAIIMLMVIVIVGVVNDDVYAGADAEAGAHGFYVDNDNYKKSYWYNTVVFHVEMDGIRIGTCTYDIGMTRTKEEVSYVYYLDHIMIKCTMKGRSDKSGYVGYSEYLTVESKIPSGASLISYSPESEANMKSYDVGFSISSDKSFGISGTTKVEKKALKINNYSVTADGLYKIGYDYINNSTFFWDTYGTYAFNESIQRGCFTIKSKKSRYNIDLKVTAKFERWDDEPGFWAFALDKYAESTFAMTYTIQ